jgi:hypothetical protein
MLLLGSLPLKKSDTRLKIQGDMSGASDENFVHVALVDLGIVEDFIDRLEGAVEEVLAKLLEASTGDGSAEVDTITKSRSQWGFGWQK